LRSALENLLGNAWKFTSQRPRARIELARDHSAETPTFFVRDDGAGFDMKHADRLFGAFQRLHARGDFAGTGVGLATVERIIARHGGRIWADAKPNEGATFYFTLPATP
jgi:light-regulated signal transduction histidine kinase (bacteriophytochrome)